MVRAFHWQYGDILLAIYFFFTYYFVLSLKINILYYTTMTTEVHRRWGSSYPWSRFMAGCTMLISIEDDRVQQLSSCDLIMVYRIFHGLVNINANELIHVKTSSSTISTRGHRFKLKREVAKNQFCNRVVCNWNNLADSIVATASIVHFKKALRTAHFEAALTLNRHY